jgi:hypothetical protein
MLIVIEKCKKKKKKKKNMNSDRLLLCNVPKLTKQSPKIMRPL